MRQLSAEEVHASKIAQLHMGESASNLTAVPALAAALRRGASHLCPCTAPVLVRHVLEPLRGLCDDLNALKDLTEATLEAMVSHGDLSEHADIHAETPATGARLLYASPPAFVWRESGAVVLLGIGLDQALGLPDELLRRIEYADHVRHLPPAPGEDLRGELALLGLLEISNQDWLRAPPRETPAQHMGRIDRLLDAVVPSREVPGLSLLDSERPTRYYRGRWVQPRSQSGRFVARRSQAYGADLWCYVEMRDGVPERLLDLPVPGGRWRGCDDAWRLQMAIDAQRGKPQGFRIGPDQEGMCLMEFFSPVPMWARRRWDAIGKPLTTPGCLLAYRFTAAEVAEEVRFARDALWLDETPGAG